MRTMGLLNAFAGVLNDNLTLVDSLWVVLITPDKLYWSHTSRINKSETPVGSSVQELPENVSFG